ncbi:MAG: hypothetical protein DMG68_09800 [Acidobacteria bacterium]|nr:MAG: hypothetical protein DMG68_09800 [Acidobacteriota bacterium]
MQISQNKMPKGLSANDRATRPIANQIILPARVRYCPWRLNQRHRRSRLQLKNRMSIFQQGPAAMPGLFCLHAARDILLRAAELAELFERRCLASLRPLEVLMLVEVSGRALGFLCAIDCSFPGWMHLETICVAETLLSS